MEQGFILINKITFFLLVPIRSEAWSPILEKSGRCGIYCTGRKSNHDPWFVEPSLASVSTELYSDNILRTHKTERLPLLGEVNTNFLQIEGVAWSAQRIPTVVNLGFLDWSRYFFLQVAPQLSS
jgi:hypothetical protein